MIKAIGIMLLTLALILFIAYPHIADGGPYGRGYRDGQIDALTGCRVIVELQEQADGSTVWVTTQPARE